MLLVSTPFPLCMESNTLEKSTNNSVALWFFSVNFFGDWGGARGVMVIIAGNGHSDTSSNPGRD